MKRKLNNLRKNLTEDLQPLQKLLKTAPAITCPLCGIAFDSQKYAPLLYSCGQNYCRQCVIQGYHTDSNGLCKVHGSHSLEFQVGWRNVELPNAVDIYSKIKNSFEAMNVGELQFLEQEELKKSLDQAKAALMELQKESKQELDCLISKHNKLKSEISRHEKTSSKMTKSLQNEILNEKEQIEKTKQLIEQHRAKLRQLETRQTLSSQSKWAAIIEFDQPTDQS